MLANIRSLARSPLAVLVIVVPMVAAFALFGISDIFRVSGNGAATVGTQQVSAQEFTRAFDNELRRIQQENPRFTRQEANEAGIGDQILNSLIAQAAVDAKAVELGLGVSDEQVRDTIRDIDAFTNPFTGVFDRSTYIRLLADNRLNEAVFEQNIRTDLRRNQLTAPLISGMTPPRVMEEARRAYAGERRRIDALLIPPSLAGDVDDPDDATLEAFIGENARIFQRPEQRRFTLVRIAPSLIVEDIAVAEEDLQSLYDSRLEAGLLADPATRTLRHWGAADAAIAEAAADRLNAGEPSDLVAVELGLGEPVVLETVQAFEVPDVTIADTAFALSTGEAAAVEARAGWRVVQVETAFDPQTPTLDEVRAELASELAMDQAADLMLDKLALFEEARGAGRTLIEAAGDAGLPVEQTDFLAASGYTADGEPAPSLLDAPEILEAVFQLPQGFDGDVTSYGDGGYFVVRVDAIDPERLPRVDEVREQVEAFWRLRQVDDQLQAVVDDAIARINAGETLEAVAASLPAGVRTESATLRRDETAGPFNAQLVRQAFGAPQDLAFPSRASDQRTRAVVMVREILPPAAGPLTGEGRAGLQNGLENDLSEVLQSALLAEYPIRRNTPIIDQVLGRNQPAG